MQGRNRKLQIDVCDYTNKIVCPIYSNQTDVSGQATEVFINYERNGWKELTFKLPTKIYTEEGEEENFRLRYIIADYRIRVVTDYETDWFLITKDSVRHEAFSKNMQVTAGHISRLLKNRSLDLEFSDDEGNNVGTARELVETILEGTGWKVGKVADFYEEDGVTVKIRSLNAPVKTGAFRLIEQVCELFEAKPVYHAEDDEGKKSVDILPMNPFSELEPGEIPEAVHPGAEENRKYLVDSKVIELHYDRYIKNLERTTDTENISTRLYGYGSYGDYVTKYCSVQTASHWEYKYVITGEITEGTEYRIKDKDWVTRYFTPSGLAVNDVLIWSMLDVNSRSYVWNENQRVAYKLYSEAKDYDAAVNLEYEAEEVTNYFPFLSDYSYYEKVGLLTDEMFQEVAKYQRDMAQYYKNAIEAQAVINETNIALTYVGIPFSGYLKLDVEPMQEEGSTFTIRWTEEHPDGVLYRSDYYNQEKKYFQWHVAQSLKANGDPTSGAASILYILKKNTDPIQWQAVYLKDIDGRVHTEDGKEIHDGYDYALSEGGRPHVITAWGKFQIEEGDSVYLFCRNDINGRLGALFSKDEAALRNLEDNSKLYSSLKSESNPTYFVNWNEPLPEINFSEFGWCYRYDSRNYDQPGVLYFSWPARGDEDENHKKVWKNVYISDSKPAPSDGDYFYNFKMKTLWHGEEGGWYHLEAVPDETRIAQMFGTVLMNCRERDKVYKGLYENYYYQTPYLLPVANYAMPTAFGLYWLFSTDQNVEPESSLRLNTLYNHLYQDNDITHIRAVQATPFDALIYPEENDMAGAKFFQGSIYINDPDKNGTDMATDRAFRSNFIPIWPNETYVYSLPQDTCFIVLYDANRNYLSSILNLVSQGEFSTSVETEYSEIVDPHSYAKYKLAKYMKIVVPNTAATEDEMKSTYYIRLKEHNKCVFYDEKKYQILEPVTYSENEEPTGINVQLRKFRDLTDKLYNEDIPALNTAQKAIIDANNDQAEVLGDILREGFWQDDSYVQGDEERLYNDCLDNLKKAAQPEIQYSFDFLDLYGSNVEDEYGLEELSNIEWPDIQITDAAHLIDPEIGVNQWAYIDKLNKCYDQPWKTTIEVNTQLTLMGQHEFKDVMARIAEVASETKGKQQIYSRAANITPEGTISGDKVEGEINTGNVQITGQGWKTDERGNMILESADGLAAIMFNGSGLSISNRKNEDGDWIWRELGTGFGLNADTISTGFLKGERIESHTITADKLMANVGNELDIGSNKALSLYATLDGLKPSGSIKTTDGIIEIYAGSEDPKDQWQRYKDYLVGNTVIYDDGTLGDEKPYWVCLEDHTSGDSFEYSKWRRYDGYTPAVIGVRSGGQINLIAGSDSENPKEAPSINIATGGSINMAAESNINMLSGSDVNIASGSNINLMAAPDNSEIPKWAQNTAYAGGDRCKHNNVVYVCETAHTSPSEFITEDSVYVYWKIDPDYRGGIINLLAGSDINLASGSSINLVSGSSLNMAGSEINMAANSKFKIEAGSFSVTTDDFVIRSKNFRVGVDEEGNFDPDAVAVTGKVTTSDGLIGSWYIGKNYLGTSYELSKSKVGLRALSGDADVVFWAGDVDDDEAKNDAPFYVTGGGKLHSSKVEITNGSIVIGETSDPDQFPTEITKDGLIVHKLTINNERGSLIVPADKLIFNTASNITAQTLFDNVSTLSQTMQGITEGTAAVSNVTTDGFTISGNQFTMNSTANMRLNAGSSLVMMADAENAAVTINQSGLTVASNCSFTALNANVEGILSGTMFANESSTLNGWMLINGSLYRSGVFLANYSTDNRAASPRNETAAEEDKVYYAMWIGADFPENAPISTSSGKAPFSIDSKGNVYANGFYRRVWNINDSTGLYEPTDTPVLFNE